MFCIFFNIFAIFRKKIPVIQQIFSVCSFFVLFHRLEKTYFCAII